MKTKEVIDKIAKTNCAEIEQIEQVLQDEEAAEYLFDRANELKHAHYGNTVFVRGIIEFSNYCSCQCAYCGINCNMDDVVRYRMQPEELVRQGILVGEVYQTVILQSGEDPFYTAPMLAEIVSRIKKQTNSAVTLSVGERTEEEYLLMRQAGADRFLIKHETADEALYETLHKTTLRQRIACQNSIRALGFQLGSGFMIGLPGQTDAILAKDLLLLKKMGVEMAGIGPFIAHPSTLLGGQPDGEAKKTLQVLALARLLLPKCHLPSTTALNVKGGMQNALLCGADVIMQKATPFEYRALYDIYPGRDAEELTFREQFEKLKDNIARLGLVAQ